MPLRVLVADDEVNIADTLALILKQRGYDAVPAYDGDSALELCAKVQPELLLTDIIMPGMSGIDLGIAVRRQNPRCKVLLISGQAGTLEMVARARESGYDFALLSKPVHPQDLLDRIAELVDSAKRVGREEPSERDRVA